MTGIEAVAAVGEAGVSPLAMQLGGPVVAAPQSAGADFGQMLMAGMRGVDAKIASADKLVQQFALGEQVPVHHVTMALEEARLSVELAMQVRARLIEGYREIMNMAL